MAIKKYTNGSWVSGCRKYGTETDTITTLPATIIGDGTPISSYTIKGNMEQSGTPTPSSPIYPSECGERTENLFDKNNYNLIRANAGTGQGILYGDPNTAPYAVYIPVTGGETYSFYSQASLFSSCFTMVTPAIGVSIVVNGANTFGSTNVRTAPADAKYLVIFLEMASATQDVIDSDLSTLAVVKSSTAPTSYIPYGYKLPITLGSTTTNIYLGEVQSTRRIKKLVLTGEETISGMTDANDGAKAVSYTYSALGMTDIVNNDRTMDVIPYPIYLSSHFKEKTSGYSSWFNINAGEIGANNALSYAINRYLIFGTSEQTQADFKAYLAQQYAAGTPVAIWYVLEEPETDIVNEPICKIGDYVDSVSGTNLATSGTAQEFDVGTTLKPSEVDLTYHGWHEHEDTKFTT